MDAPVDFSRARHLGNGNLGNYDQGFNENVHTTRPGSTSVSLPEIARVGTPTPLPGLGQYPSRFMHPSLISTAGAGYPLLSNLGYLPASGGASGAAALGSGSGLMGDHLKSLLPDLQQYPWNSPGEGRYALNNNNIYSTQYLNYIHGNESLPLFPTSASVGNSTAPAQVQAQMLAAYHRIYDLQKEVMLASHANPSSSALHSPYAPGISPPVTRMSNDLHSPTAIAGKKEHNRSHSESKQRSSESTSKSHGKAGDGSSSLKQHGGKSGKEGRDSKRQCKTDRKGDCKESERRTETRDTKDRALSSKSDTKSSEKKSCEVQQEQTTSQNVVTEKNCSSDQDKNKCDVDGDETELEIDVPGEDNVIKSNLESSAKSESTKFLGSVSPSSGKELSDSSFSMVVTHAPSQCAISPPMFHCSKSEMMVSPGSAKSGSSGEGRKIHAPTFTPEIGTLPSVVAVANMPIQTTACDMRIKKEKVTYSSCKNKGMTSCPRTCETNLKQGDSLKPGIDKDFSNGDGKRKLTKRITDNQEKTRKKSDKGVVHPVKHTPEKSSRQNNSKDKLKHDEQLTNQDDDENICVTLNPFEHGRKEKSKNQSSENMDSENINLKKCSERHSLTSNQELRNSHKDSDFSAIDICNQTNISESIEKCDKDEKDAKYNGEDKEEKDDNGKIHTSQVTMPSGVKLSQAQARTQSKLSEKLLRARELNKKGGKRKDDNSSGMSIPIGIAVAQKREELKEESPGTENRNREDAHQRGGLHGNTSGLHRVDGGQSSAFIGPILPKSTNNSGHVSVADIRNSLPSNLIVTGSASGTGIAWADDPTTRSFTSPWIAAGPPPSWISQVPFPLHSNIPTSLATGEQPSLTVPPGYKLIQDSVTGQLVLLPSTSFSDVYDPSRMWNPSIANMASGSTFQQLMAVHHQSSLAPPVLNRQADLALVVQRYQQQLQSMYQHLPHTESSFQNVGINLSLPMKSVTPKEVCKDDETKVECVKDVDESKDVDVMTTKDDDEEENEKEIEGESENRKTPSSVENTFVNKKEQEHKIDFNDNKAIGTTSESDSIRFLSRDFNDEKNEETKPNNTAQSPLDYTSIRNAKCYSTVEKSNSIVDESLFQSNLHDAPDQKTLKVLDENISNISQTSLNCGLLVSEGIVREGEKIKNLPSDSVRVKVEDDVKFPKIHVIDQTVASEIKTSDGSSSDSAENKLHSSCEISCDEGKTRENDNCVQQTDSSSAAKNDPYPFLDPQILMAADGLELLSVLAEQRSKCLEVSQTQDNSMANSEIVEKQKTLETEPQIPLPNKSEITCNNIENNESPKTDDFKKTDNTELGPCKSKLSANSSNGNKNDGPIARKRTFSRTRSIPPKSEINSDQSDYYTSTGLRIPQGEEEINAIELDMRIRLAELQRQYKEKQKQLAKLHPKKDRDRSKEKTKDKVKDKNKSKEKEKDKGKEKERENKGHDKEREKERTKETKKEQVTDKDADRDYDNRKPGRPKKKGKLPENKSDALTNKGNGKGKDIPRKRKQAEELVDRVFRKTGGGFGMPLSKKLKANAMASLFKTQSGFTVKRKNSSSSSSSVLPFSTKTDKDRPTESLKAKKSLTKFMSAGAFSSEKETQKYKKLPAFGERYTNDKSPSYSQASDEKEESDTKSTLGIKAEKKLIKPFTGNSPEEKTAPSASLFKLENGHSEKVSKTVENDTSPPKKIKLIKTDSLSENQTNNLPESVPRPVTPPHCSEHAHADLTNPLDSPASSTKKGSEGESSSESTPSMHKKRKPGRPRKYNSNTTPGVTETIVARHSKSFFYNQFHSFEDVVKAHNSQEKKVKIENPTSMKPLFLDEEWLLRRSERIFLSEPSPQPSPNTSKEPQKSPVNTTSSLKRQSSTLQPSPLTSQSQETASQAKEEKNKKQKALSIKEITEKVKKKYSKTFKLPQGKIKPRSSSLDSKEHTLKKKEKIKSMEPSESQLPKMPAEDQSPDSSDSEGDNLPLSVLRERPEVPAPRSCAINKSELINGLRVLVFKDGLFYEGAVQEIHPPDVYGVLIDNERGNRPIIYSQEEILKEVIVDVRPSSSKTLVEGTRVCAYWSQQFSCLYPGTVAKASPNPHSDISLTNVEFDDGDSGKIPLDHIRMLPQDFPLVAYDPNPLLLIGKRRRHTTNESTDTSRRRSVSVTDSNKSKRGRPPKGKKSDRNNVDDDYEEGEEEEVDVCGFDDDPDDVFENDKSKAKFKTLNAKKKRKRQVTTSDSETDDRNNAKDKHFSDEDDDDDKSDEEDNEDGDDAEYSPKKKRKEDRNTSSDQVVTPARQLWKWSGTSTKRPGLKGKAKKEYYKAIVRGKEKIEVGECAVFLSTGRPHLPYIGRIHSMWEAWGGQMVVKVKWFYHPEETRGGKKLQDMKGALFQSLHMDENDVQTISHKCEVVSCTEYRRRCQETRPKEQTLYYLGGTYEPTIGLLKFEKDMGIV